MAIKLNKGSKGTKGKPAASAGSKAKSGAQKPGKGFSKGTAKPGNTGSFMTGKQALQAQKKAEAEAERRRQEAGKLFTFFLKPGDETTITFLDGNLDEDGILDAPALYRHEFFNNGKFSDYVCLHTNPDWGPCPICESGDNPSFITAFTVIDHTKFKGKDDKIYQDRRKLLIAKQNSTKMLTKLAQKEGGLAGVTFEVSRTSDKDPRVGNLYIPQEAKGMDEIVDLYGEEMVPADYEQEFHVYSREELVQMGFGGGSSVGNEQAPNAKTSAGSGYEGQL